MSAEEPAPITIPGNVIATSTLPNSLGNITCICWTTFHQRTTVEFAGESYVFNGKGIGALMTLKNGETSCQINSVPDPVKVVVKFEYSETGEGPYKPASHITESFKDEHGFFVVYLGAASGQPDSNGALLAITAVSVGATGSPVPRKTEEAVPLAPGDALVLHAKTYYNDPDIHGGDQHLVVIPKFAGPYGDLEYSSTSFDLVEGNVWNEGTPLGGYLHIEVTARANNRSKLQGALLTLTTVYSYWGLFPTGHSETGKWSAELVGTKYKITKVTN